MDLKFIFSLHQFLEEIRSLCLYASHFGGRQGNYGVNLFVSNFFVNFGVGVDVTGLSDIQMMLWLQNVFNILIYE